MSLPFGINPDVLQGKILLNEPLAGYTTWRVGGSARLMYKPKDIEDLSVFLQACSPSDPILWLGLGSNSLIKDGGVPGIVIVTLGCLNQMTLLPDHQIRVEAGVSCAKMARFSARNGLSGGEFWAGIPGTMGGALRMNAGCFHRETWETVVAVETILRTGERRLRQPQEFDIGYRHVAGLEQDEWFVAAICQLTPGEQAQSTGRIKELLAHRTATQPTSEYNCGSVFRNPPDGHAAKLIESCGLKGHQIGGAMVSEKHANFIINHQGEACAKDIEQLITYVQQTVHEKTGVSLVHEVHILGEDTCPSDSK
ncbi:MAG: UDP-N-acetylmuramate dehydrogenase [Gammaproteobacteria bacterium]|nr:UDP-N-acetylmuramate dehydrogenase [Gammaproteobacteria bacterium]